MNVKTDNSIQIKILETLDAREGCSLGYLVKELDYTYHEILDNLIRLKHQGQVNQSMNLHGYFISNN